MKGPRVLRATSPHSEKNLTVDELRHTESEQREERAAVLCPRSDLGLLVPKYIRAKMESEGQKGTANPSSMLASLLNRRTKLHEELRNIEKQVYDMETSYLQDPGQCGNVLKGFEGFLSSSKSTAFLKRSRKFQPEDRLFSLSSVTSPAAEELAAGRDDGRSDFGPGRSKGGGIYVNGQAKPKKGRGGPRDAKRMRPSSEQDFDYEDDPDLTL